MQDGPTLVKGWAVFALQEESVLLRAIVPSPNHRLVR